MLSLHNSVAVGTALGVQRLRDAAAWRFCRRAHCLPTFPARALAAESVAAAASHPRLRKDARHRGSGGARGHLGLARIARHDQCEEADDDRRGGERSVRRHVRPVVAVGDALELRPSMWRHRLEAEAETHGARVIDERAHKDARRRLSGVLHLRLCHARRVARLAHREPARVDERARGAGPRGGLGLLRLRRGDGRGDGRARGLGGGARLRDLGRRRRLLETEGILECGVLAAQTLVLAGQKLLGAGCACAGRRSEG
mmetsp:Transcript_58345/g.126730  ORF Transcript_58345/g.126730 Transcript_58345/m.126730 type:complete len:257 (+) Transcript_58345:613-1383(+)